MPATRLSRRICARLAQAELCESNAHYRDDLRIARLTVSHAARGDAVLCSPHVLASYEVLGLHPDKVWPAIQARRKALGLCEETGAPPVPKKPAQSVKLWCEKTNGARAANSRAVTTLLRDNTISVPMAAPSIAALYPKSDAPSSAKRRLFSLEELKQLIHYSGAPHPTRALTIAALDARGPWPNEDGPATAILCISLKGMMLEGGVCKRTVQRRIKRACNLGFWRRTREANTWSDCPKCGAARDSAQCPNDKCTYKGSTKNKGEFTRPHTYEFDLEKFMSAKRCREIHSEDWRSYSEYKQANRAEQSKVKEWPRKPTQPSPSPDNVPPTTEAPAKKPAAEYRGTQRPEPKPAQPKLTRRECAKFVANFEQRKRGHTSYFSRADGGMKVALHPGEEGYAAPVSAKEAFEAECEAWTREPDVVREALQFYGYKLQE